MRTNTQHLSKNKMYTDCHIHCALSGFRHLPKGLMAKDAPERRSFFIRTVKDYQKAGVIALRDGGDCYGASIAFKAYCEDVGIAYKTPVHALYQKGCYGNFLGIPVDGTSDLKAVWEGLMSKRPDFIKIIATGIMDFEHYGQVSDTGFAQSVLNALIARAHDAGLDVMVHVNTPAKILEAIEAGADTIEHGYMMDDACIAAMAERGTIWVPTLAPFANMARCPEGHFVAPFRKVCARYFEGHQQAVRKAHAAGVVIAPGSDAGSTLVGHGRGILDEYTYLTACGVPKQALDKAAAQIMGGEVK